MPSLNEYEKSRFVKVLFVGASGAGKTGALTSLVEAGYQLRIADFDSGLDALIFHLKEKKLDLSKVQFMSFRDKVKMGPTGTKLDGPPRAYPGVLAALDEWEDGSNPSEWGEDTVFVLDSLTNVGRAAFWWAKHTNPMTKEPRQWYSTGQDLLLDLLANLTAETFRAHVIVISHLVQGQDASGMMKQFASSLGKAKGPIIPSFFNTMLLSEMAKGQRLIHTVPTRLLDLKNPAPSIIKDTYPMESGLADIFKVLRA
jgi:hypothetical protein